jgi:hypothetical protein
MVNFSIIWGLFFYFSTFPSTQINAWQHEKGTPEFNKLGTIIIIIIIG